MNFLFKVNGDVKEPERSRMIRDLAVEVKKVPNFLSEAKIRYSQLTTKRPTKPIVSFLFLRDVISKNGQISPRLFRTQFLFVTKIKRTYEIVLPNT